jgi:hypothetical protein
MTTFSDHLNDELLTVWEALVGALTEARVERRDGYVFLSYPKFPSPVMNGIWSLGDNPAAAQDLASALDEIEAMGVTPGVVVRDHEAPALEEEARRLGLTEPHRVPGMIATAGSFRPADAAGIDVVSARSRALLDQALDVAAAGFGFPREWAEEFYSPGALERRLTVYLGLAAGRGVTTAVACRTASSVGIFNVSTPPEERRRGYGAAVTSRAAADGLAEGAETVWLQASGMGDNVYRRLGFEQVSTYELWVRPGTDTANVGF